MKGREDFLFLTTNFRVAGYKNKVQVYELNLVITLSQILRSRVLIDEHHHICLRSQHPFVELIQAEPEIGIWVPVIYWGNTLMVKILKEESETWRGEGKKNKELSKDVTFDEV